MEKTQEADPESNLLTGAKPIQTTCTTTHGKTNILMGEMVSEILNLSTSKRANLPTIRQLYFHISL